MAWHGKDFLGSLNRSSYKQLTRVCRWSNISFVAFASSSMSSYPSITSGRKFKSGIALLLVFFLILWEDETDSVSDTDWSMSKSLCGSLGVERPLLALEPPEFGSLLWRGSDANVIFLTGVWTTGVLSGDEDCKGLPLMLGVLSRLLWSSCSFRVSDVATFGPFLEIQTRGDFKIHLTLKHCDKIF